MNIYQTSSEGLRHFYFSHNTTGTNLVVSDTYTNNLSVKKTIATSYDNISWSNPVDLIDFNPPTSFPIGIEKSYFRLSITVTKNSFNEFSSYSLDKIEINTDLIEIENMEIGQQFESVLRLNSDSQNLFNPYRFSDFQKDLYDKLSLGANNVIGFPMLYFRTESDDNNESVTFKTYKLNNVVEVKQIKISVEGNNVPDNLERFDAYGFDFQDELIVHIVKEVFWNAFGTDKIPNSNDYFYWAMTDRMYQVNSPYQKKTFMNHATYWAVITTKFENRASVKEIDDDDDFHKIDDIIEFTNDWKSEIEKLEQEDATKDYNESEKFFSDNNQNISDDNNENFNYSFDYSDIEVNTVSKTSNFFQPLKENDLFSVSTWIKFSQNQSLIKLYNNEFGDNILIQTNTFGNGFTISVNYETRIVDNLPPISTQIVFNDPTELNKNTWYGLIVKLHNNDLIMEVYDSGIELINQKVTSVTKIKNVPNKIDIYGGIKFNMIRVSKKDISSYDLLNNKLPKKMDFVMMMNASPTISSPKEN